MSFNSNVQVTAGTKATQSIFTHALGTSYDLFYANHVPSIYKRFGKDFYDTLLFIQSLGRIQPVDSEVVTLHEANRYHNYLTVGVSPVTFQGSDYKNTNAGTTVHIVSNTYARVGDIVSLSYDGSEQGYISAVNTDTSIDIVLRGAYGTIDGSAGTGTYTLPAGQIMTIVSGAFADGTDQPLPAVSGISETTFTPQIIKEAVQTNGREMVEGLWFEEPQIFWSDQLLQGEYRQSLKIGGAMLMGQSIDPNNKFFTTNDIVTTKGLVPTIKSRGGNMTYTAGSWNLTDLDDIALYMEQNGVTSQIVCILAGRNYINEFDNAAKDFLGGGNTKMVAEGFSGSLGSMFAGMDNHDRTEDGYAKMMLDFNFKFAQIHNTSYVVKTETAFTNPTLWGAPGMTLPWNAIVFPFATISDAKDTTLKLDNLAIRPLAKGGYNRFMEIFKRGAAGGDKSTYVDGFDRLRCDWRSDFMVQIAGANQMVYIERA